MKDIEKNIRERLNSYPSPVDTDRLWKGIDAQLQQRRRRRRWFWLPFWVFGAAGVAALGWWLWPSGGANPAEESIQVGTFTEAEAATDEVLHWQVSTSGPEATMWQENIAVKFPEKTDFQREKSPLGSENADGKKASKAQYGGATQAQSRSGNFEYKSGSAVDINAGLPHNNAAQIIQEAAPNLPFLAASNTGEDIPGILDIVELSPLPMQLYYVFYETMPDPGLPDDPTADSDYLKKKKRKKARAFSGYAGVHTGLQYPWKRLQADSDEFAGVVQLRKDSEKVLESWSAGLFAGLQHRSGLALEVGAEYQRINERFRMESRTTDTLGSAKIVKAVVDPSGDTIFLTSLEPVVQHTHIRHTTYNNYRFVQLPVGFTYTLRRAGPWQPFVRAGVQFNLHFRYKAEVFVNADPQHRLFRSEDSGEGAPFRTTRLGLAPYAAVGARFQVKPALSLFGEIRYQHHTSPVTNAAYPAVQQYRLPGVNVGARLDLGL